MVLASRRGAVVLLERLKARGIVLVERALALTVKVRKLAIPLVDASNLRVGGVLLVRSIKDVEKCPWGALLFQTSEFSMVF